MRHAVSLLLALGCSDDPGGADKCEPGGAYLASYEELGSGTCGPLPDEVITSADTGSGTDCTVDSRTESADGCNVDAEMTCPTDAAGWTIHSKSIVDWRENTLLFDATLIDPDGYIDCRSTYRVTLTPQ